MAAAGRIAIAESIGVAVRVQTARAVLQDHFRRALDQGQRPVAGHLGGGEFAGAIERDEIDNIDIAVLRQIRL
jgi:hypothetical protein